MSDQWAFVPSGRTYNCAFMLIDKFRLARILLFITPALWAVNYIVAKAAIDHIEPHALALLRWSIALLLMLPFSYRELADKWPLWAAEWKEMLFLGACGMWICGAFVYIGAKTTAAINIALLYAIAPVLIASVSAVWFHEKLHLRQWLGGALALAGMLLIISKASWVTFTHLSFTVGDWWIVAAVISWTFYSLVLKNKSSCLSVFSRSTVITLGGVLLLIPLTIVEMTMFGFPSRVDEKALMLGVIAALVPGFAAYQAYSFMQSELGAAKAGIVLYLGPLYGALTGYLFLNEQPQLFHFVGAALILPGVYFATKE
jgi:drug/metabolite transporter (DMT)-like permease